MLKRLSEVEGLVENAARGESDQASQALTGFLVIRSCGYLEKVVESCVLEYVESMSAPAVLNFVMGAFGRGANPQPDRLIALVKRFDARWASELNQLFAADDGQLKREVAFLVSCRNKIAHGESESVAHLKALKLSKFAQKVANWFIDTFDPPPSQQNLRA
ncbi:MAG: HEPN domain-containing protein [Acidimicrobiia bacterium]